MSICFYINRITFRTIHRSVSLAAADRYKFLSMKRCIPAILLAGLAWHSAAGQTPARNESAPSWKAAVYITAQNTGDRLTKKELPAFEAVVQPEESHPYIMIDPGKTFQSVEGFGGAFTDAAAETFYKLPEKQRAMILEAYFSPEKGIGYSLCRTNINSCDFSSDSYSYDETDGDTTLSDFNIDHDRKYKIPFIKAALEEAGGTVRILASPWSPPAWMKTNRSMLHGGKLRPECYSSWARYFVRFMQEYQSEGIPIWGFTVQNEPMASQTWESCIFTGEEERDFVKNHLGPALARSETHPKLIIWDHNRGIMYQRAQTVLDDPGASRFVWGTGFHWYVGDHFDNVRLVHDAWPDKNLIFTEATVASFHADRIGNWGYGEKYGESIISDLNNWASGWIDWNLLLDEKGGPNHVGNFCMATMIGDTRTGEVKFMNAYYYIGHFSKFIRPGARRIVSSSDDDRFLTTAFLNPDGKIEVVVMNKTTDDIDYQLWLGGEATRLSSPAHSIETIELNPGNEAMVANVIGLMNEGERGR